MIIPATQGTIAFSPSMASKCGTVGQQSVRPLYYVTNFLIGFDELWVMLHNFFISQKWTLRLNLTLRLIAMRHTKPPFI